MPRFDDPVMNATRGTRPENTLPITALARTWAGLRGALALCKITPILYEDMGEPYYTQEEVRERVEEVEAALLVACRAYDPALVKP